MNDYSGLIALFLLIVALVLFVKYEASHEDDEEETIEKAIEEPAYQKEVSRLDLNDEDATVACLVASIDYRKQTGKNVRIVSIREVK